MHFVTIEDFTANGVRELGRKPLGIILAEDMTELDTTIRHHIRLGFDDIVVIGSDDILVPEDLRSSVDTITHDLYAEGAFETALNPIIAAVPGKWVYFCYNAEYLFYPFSESRSINEAVTFMAEERRDAVLCYVIDLYAVDLGRYPDGVSIDEPYLDRSGYYAQARLDPETNYPLDRQLDMFGGLRWRFEEHIPKPKRKIDRIGVFKAKPGLTIRPDHTFSDPEYNTYACPWHNNLTMAVCSFRTAKALKANPGSSSQIPGFWWHNSEAFRWKSQQLMDLGLMEPGQWF